MDDLVDAHGHRPGSATRQHSGTRATTATDSHDEVAVLRRQLERERDRRVAAEEIGEKATADLVATVEELREIQAEILEKAERARVINELAREMRLELDTGRLLSHAARAIGQATLVDRCQIHRIHPANRAGDWADRGAGLPAASPLTWHPIELLQLLQVAEEQRECVRIADVDDDPRISAAGAAEFVNALGVRAILVAPMWVGDLLVGWLTLHSRTPREWRERERDICSALATDLGTSLLQVQAFEQQAESMRRLRELDRAKDDFISNVSHELRTPLTSISGYLELMAQGDLGPVDPRVEHAVGVLGRNTERLRGLVEDLLALSAYDAAAAPLERVTVDLAAVLAECRGALMPLLARRDLDVQVQVPEALAPIRADRTQLERVVLNLLSNAVKFTPDGGRITLTAADADTAPGDGVVLSIADTGMGIPQDEQEMLFTRFFRSSSAMAAEIQGTGLGLALTKTLIEQHGGTVTIDSAEGVGTTVTVRLPRDEPTPLTD